MHEVNVDAELGSPPSVWRPLVDSVQHVLSNKFNPNVSHRIPSDRDVGNTSSLTFDTLLIPSCFAFLSVVGLSLQIVFAKTKRSSKSTANGSPVLCDSVKKYRGERAIAAWNALRVLACVGLLAISIVEIVRGEQYYYLAVLKILTFHASGVYADKLGARLRQRSS